MEEMLRVYRLPDGRLGFTSAPWNDTKNGFDPAKETELEYFDRWTKHKIPADWTFVADITKADLPRGNDLAADELTGDSRRLFRDCWEWDGVKCAVNMAKARAQRLAEVRKARDTKWPDLDGRRAKFADTADAAKLNRVVDEAQALRDIPAIAAVELSAISDPEAAAGYEPPWPAKVK